MSMRPRVPMFIFQNLTKKKNKKAVYQDFMMIISFIALTKKKLNIREKQVLFFSQMGMDYTRVKHPKKNQD